ncbi:MAG: hypothetical protein AAFR37_13845 [Cyanobacteria bacterium J06628_3]
MSKRESPVGLISILLGTFGLSIAGIWSAYQFGFGSQTDVEYTYTADNQVTSVTDETNKLEAEKNTPIPTPTPTPTPQTDEPVVSSKRLNFGFSDTATIRGSLKENQTVQYTFRADEGQVLTAVLVEENGVSLTVLGPNKEFVDSAARQVSSYRGNLPVTGTYTIELNNLPDISRAEYTLRVTLREPVNIIPEIEPTPTPEIEPTEPVLEETPTPENTEKPKRPRINIPTSLPTSLPTNIPTPKIPDVKIPDIKLPSIKRPKTTPSQEERSKPEGETRPEAESNSEGSSE